MPQKVRALFGFYTLNADEVGVKLRFGKFAKQVNPGLGYKGFGVSVIKTKSSLQTADLEEQQIVLQGNIAIRLSGNLNYKVADAQRALLTVNDYRYTIRRYALTTIAEVMSSKTIEELRTEKEKLTSEIEYQIKNKAEEWGLSEIDVRLTDAQLDQSLLRAMMRETEAEKESNAIKIKAEADRVVAQIFSEAAKTMESSPGAMTLRILQSLNDMSNNKSTIVVPIPIELLSGGGNKKPIEEALNAKIQISEEKIIATCPYCKELYNVSSVINKKEMDENLEIPGLQIRCRECNKYFTLPEVEFS